MYIDPYINEYKLKWHFRILPYKDGMEGEVVGSKPSGCACKLAINSLVIWVMGVSRFKSNPILFSFLFISI